MSYEDAFKEYGGKKMTPSLRGRVEKTLRQEVKTYDDYLTGNVHGFMVTSPDGEDLDSCWGFYGDKDGIAEEAKAAVDFDIKEIEKEAWTKAMNEQNQGGVLA